MAALRQCPLHSPRNSWRLLPRWKWTSAAHPTVVVLSGRGAVFEFQPVARAGSTRLLRRIAAEMAEISTPTGKISMNVNAMRVSGFE
jgi:CelD/BcsL family acetyltransferase involved in cellulose biosynthesis